MASISPGMMVSSIPFKTSTILPLPPKTNDFFSPWV
jgi:hypothetical protein